MYGMEVNDKKILIIVPAPKKKDKHLPRTLAHREPSLQYIMYTRNDMIWAARESKRISSSCSLSLPLIARNWCSYSLKSWGRDFIYTPEVHAICTEAMPESQLTARIEWYTSYYVRAVKKDFLHARVSKRKVKFSFEVISPTLIDKKKKWLICFVINYLDFILYTRSSSSSSLYNTIILLLCSSANDNYMDANTHVGRSGRGACLYMYR